jgi:S-(hydroxymethyl)glutathione dehydrogenase / alcohol dehydrogenase
MMPRSMTAAVLTALHHPLEMMQIELPNSLKEGQVLVKIAYSGICGSQLGEIDGVKGDDLYLPHLLGHEGSGIVEDVGVNVSTVKIGDHVVLHWRKGLGADAATPVYFSKSKRINAGQITTFNEYAVVSENRVTFISQEADLKIAALFGCAVTTGFGVIKNNAKLRKDESVVIFGAGGVGLNMIQAASLSSAYPIIAIDRFESRLTLSKKIGATHCINTTQCDAVKKINEIVGDRKLNCFIDNTGNTKIIEMGYKITASNGKVVLVGVPRHNENISIHSLPLHFGKTITGSHGGESLPHKDIPFYFNLVEQKKINLENLITDIFELNDINHAINAMRSGKIAGRCLIKMN